MLPGARIRLPTRLLPEIDNGPLRTLYMGGGTPAMLGCEGLKTASRRNWLHGCRSGPSRNGRGTQPRLGLGRILKALAAIGVNRISIGVQRFDDATLARMGRRHDAQAASARAVKRAQDAGLRTPAST
jgi:oxygen-independent coproporphyrinogen-3 oxidase